MSPRPDLIVRELPEGLVLLRGPHNAPGGDERPRPCLLEAASWLAGEPWSDRPECVCPTIAAFARVLNDALDQDERQVLLPYARRIVGTRGSDALAERRGWMAADWLIRERAPAWLRAAGLHDHAEALAALAPIDSPERARAARALTEAAWAAARAVCATGQPAEAAWAAARTVRAGRVDAVGARDAARAAAAAGASGVVDREGLGPTQRAVQASALCLLTSMIAAREPS